ncbi:hypothetical protein PSR1_04266 [Anaeromyxobacter sp. PSR-1]|nr:hypothetical protein PSR1_04266 [Anaeromyxobacter sp. PSR-1]
MTWVRSAGDGSRTGAGAARSFSSRSSSARSSPGNEVAMIRASAGGSPGGSSGRTPCVNGSSASRRSLAHSKRCAGSRASARSTRASSSGGSPGRARDGGGTSARRTRSSTESSDFPLNSRAPVSISCSTTPSENTSER